jgi:Transcription initiation factor TFIID subunit A
VIDVGNDFITQVLEHAFELARLRPDRKVTIQDVQFILEKRMKMPINAVEIENDQGQR